MKPNFALNLSHSGLSLLRRATNGWRVIGEVALDDPAMAEKLRILRKTASELAGGQLGCKVVIPNSQVLYREVDTLGADENQIPELISQALDGATPYAIDDLVFDWRTVADGRSCVAAVAQETLDEAEHFAAEHRFNPLSFVAIPDFGDFFGEPFFGASKAAAALLGADQVVEADTDAIAILEASAEDEDATIAHDKTNGDTLDMLPLVGQAEPDPDEPTAAFSTRRSDEGPAMVAPNLDRQEARLSLYPDKVSPTADMPAVGSASRDQEITKMAVTAPSLAAEAPVEKSKKVAKRPGRKKPKTVPAIPLPAAPELDLEFTAAAKVTADAKALQADPLTVFGARRLPQSGGYRIPLGFLLTAVLVVFLLLAALISSFIFDTPVAVSGLWGSSTKAPEVAAPSEIDQPVAPPISDTTAGEPEIAAVAPDVETATPDDEITALAPTSPTVPALEETLDDAELAEFDGSDGVGAGLTLEEAAAYHAEYGLWPLAPTPPVALDTGGLDDLYIASIDRRVITNDAVALPSGATVAPGFRINEMLPPAPAGTRFDFDERGFVRARPDGATTPDGVRVYAGKPSYVPPVRGGDPVAAESETIAPSAVPTTRPIARPVGIIESDQKSRLGGRTRTELAAIRPIPRPASPQDSTAETDLTPTEFAVAQSPSPVVRPNGMSKAVESALAQALADDTTVVAAAAVAAPSSPSIPTRASVAREATIKNAINLSKVNLIGIYGSSSDRRALVRLKTGRYVKVQIGDRLDGGKVAAIGANKLQYIKGGRTVTLEMSV